MPIDRFTLKILIIYHAGETYTNTVFEHLSSFASYSRHDIFYCHHDQYHTFDVDLTSFDAVIIHYSLRLPYNQISLSASLLLADFRGLKALFIQDEYDHTRKAWDWIQRLGVNLVFTVVPKSQIERVYPADFFPNVRFVNNLTGYVSTELLGELDNLPIAQRRVVVGYRARELPLRYGQLGFEKVEIGKLVKTFCTSRGIIEDIAWTETTRIYGAQWNVFIRSCRAMLGSESGSNVFDWDGTLDKQVEQYRKLNPTATDYEVYSAVVLPHELPGVMNQISPRIFECAAAHTALVLFEGSYSEIVKPWQHYIPVKKDGSNLQEVFAKLADDKFLLELTSRAWEDLIRSGKYSYSTFVRMVDQEIEQGVERTQLSGYRARIGSPTLFVTKPSILTAAPLRALPLSRLDYLLGRIWKAIPEKFRAILRPGVRAFRRYLRAIIPLT